MNTYRQGERQPDDPREGNELLQSHGAHPLPAPMPERAPDLLDALTCEPSLAGKLRAAAKGDACEFENVTEGAMSALCAAMARAGGTPAPLPPRRLWLVCPTPRAQEQLHNELIQWFPDALFFPELEIAPIEGALPDPEAVADRVAIVQRLGNADDSGRAPILVLTKASLEDAVPDPAALRNLELQVIRGQKLDRDALLRKLTDAGYESAAQVSQRGQFAVRGGIVDVFSFHHPSPVRLELFDDEVESIRQFDLDAQTSVEQLPSCIFLLGTATANERKLRDCIREEDVTVDVAAGWLEAKVSIASDFARRDVADELTTDDTDNTDGESDDAPTSPLEREASAASAKAASEPSGPPTVEFPITARETPVIPSVSSVSSVVVPSVSSAVPGALDFSLAFFDNGLGDFEAGDFVVDEVRRERFFAQLTEWRLQNWKTFVFCNNEGEIERLHDLIPAVEADALRFVIGTLGRGFTFPAGKVAATRP